MALYHAYSQTVADGTATSVVRPSDWNSGHVQRLTLSGNTAGQSTVSGTNIVFQGGNNITLSATTGAGVATVIVSAAAAGITGGVGMSNVGNTAGTTGMATNQLVLVGGNNVSLSQNLTDGYGTITINAGVTNSNTFWDPYLNIPASAGQVGQASLHINPVGMPSAMPGAPIAVNRFVVPLYYSNASNSTCSATISVLFGLYTKNGASLSLYASVSGSFALTGSGTVNSSIYNGIRNYPLDWTTTIQPNMYYAAMITMTTTGGNNGSFSQMLIPMIASSFSGWFGSATHSTYQSVLGRGVYTMTTSGLPSSIELSQIRGISSGHLRPPMWHLYSN